MFICLSCILEFWKLSLAFENWNGRINSAIYYYPNFAKVRGVLNEKKLVNFREKFKISQID